MPPCVKRLRRRLPVLQYDGDSRDAWFWSEEWQAGECEADADYAAGRVKRFATVEELIADLNDYGSP